MWKASSLSLEDWMLREWGPWEWLRSLRWLQIIKLQSLNHSFPFSSSIIIIIIIIIIFFEVWECWWCWSQEDHGPPGSSPSWASSDTCPCPLSMASHFTCRQVSLVSFPSYFLNFLGLTASLIVSRNQTPYLHFPQWDKKASRTVFSVKITLEKASFDVDHCTSQTVFVNTFTKWDKGLSSSSQGFCLLDNVYFLSLASIEFWVCSCRIFIFWCRGTNYEF